jgi:hypothetical protein
VRPKHVAVVVIKSWETKSSVEIVGTDWKQLRTHTPAWETQRLNIKLLQVQHLLRTHVVTATCTCQHFPCPCFGPSLYLSVKHIQDSDLQSTVNGP